MFKEVENLIDEKLEEKITDVLEGSGIAGEFMKKKDFQNLPTLDIFVFANPGYDLLAACHLIRTFTAAINNP